MVREVRAPKGTELACKGWLREAAYRMIQNNIDPDVAEIPEELIVYDGIGKAARNWECFDKILEALKNLENDETLFDNEGQAQAFREKLKASKYISSYLKRML